MRTRKRWLYAGLLLLMLAAPMRAKAETSSGVIYHSGPASLESNGEEAPQRGTPPPKDHPGPKPKTGEEARAGTHPTPAGEPESEEGHEPQAATPGAGGGHPPGGGGEAKAGASPKPSARSRSAGSTGPTQPEKMPAKVDSSASGGGGSSPVVPILIAMAVLAALSIGTVIYRGRTPQAS